MMLNRIARSLKLAAARTSVRPVHRRAAMVENLETRALMSVTVANDGRELGTLETWEPEGGVRTAPAGVTGRNPGGDGTPGFQITLAFAGGLTASQQAIFSQAAARWEAILTGDIPDNNQTSFGFVDDVRIEAKGAANDGPGGVLGSAGPYWIRSDSYLPITGNMNFDSADLATLESQGMLDEVIVHEMGHVLGIGTLWPEKNLLTGATTADPRFTGPAATAEYKRLSGLNVTGVPVANEGGGGTRDSHWREGGTGGTGLGNELMSGYLNGNIANPLSRVSAASMIDLGYPLVDVDAAELYTIPTNPAAGDYRAVNPLPVVGSLTASNEVVRGNDISLTLASATDNNSVGSISFYRETNGIAGLQATGTVGSDTFIVTNPGNDLTADVATGNLASGNYTFYARAADNFGAFSAVASKTVTVTTLSAPIQATAPTLLAADDTGVSNSDGLTRLNVITFVGTAAAGSTVTLRNGPTVLGTGTASLTGDYSIQTTTLASGSYAVTATASNAAGSAPASTATNVRVDTAAPTVGGTTYDREVSQTIRVTLDEAVAGNLPADSVSLRNLTSGQTVTVSSVTLGEDGTTLTVEATGLFADGNYQLTVPAATLTDLAGNALATDLTFGFRQLAGDANDDGTVNFADLVRLAQNYNSSGKTFSQGNFNYSADGTVNFADLVLLAQNYNKALAVATPAAVTSGATIKTGETKPSTATDVVG